MKFLADPLRPCYIIKVGASPRSCCCVLLSDIMFLPKKEQGLDLIEPAADMGGGLFDGRVSF